MFFTTLIYPLHLWSVNLAVGLPLLCLWLDLAGRDNEPVRLLNRRLARTAWVALLAGSLLGTVHLATIWDEAWSAKLVFAGSRIMFGVVELLTSLLLLIAYDLWLRRTHPKSRALYLIRWFLPLIAGTNLLYHFPVLFGVLKQIDVGGISAGGKLTSQAFRDYLLRGEIISNWLHFLLASVAVSGAVAVWIALRIEPRQNVNFKDRWLVRLAGISAAGTFLQWVAGPLVFVFETRHVQFILTGGDWLMTGWFMQTMLLVLVLCFLQLRLVFYPRTVSLAGYVVLLQLAIIFAMSLVRLLLSN